MLCKPNYRIFLINLSMHFEVYESLTFMQKVRKDLTDSLKKNCETRE